MDEPFRPAIEAGLRLCVARFGGQLRALYRRWQTVFDRTGAILDDPLAAAVTPEDYVEEIAAFCRWSIDRIERGYRRCTAKPDSQSAG